MRGMASDHRCGRSHHRSDSLRRLTLPVRADHHVEAGLRAVLLADVRELVCTRIIERIHPEALAEVRHLENDGLVIQVVKEADPVHDILVGADDEVLVRGRVIGQHRDRVVRDRHHPAEQAGFGRLRKSRVAVGIVDERPAPHISHARDRLHVAVVKFVPGVGPGTWAAVCGIGTCCAQAFPASISEAAPAASRDRRSNSTV